MKLSTDDDDTDDDDDDDEYNTTRLPPLPHEEEDARPIAPTKQPFSRRHTPARPTSLNIIHPDDVLDMSADNTLSFVFTKPPKHSAFTVHVSYIDEFMKITSFYLFRIELRHNLLFHA